MFKIHPYNYVFINVINDLRSFCLELIIADSVVGCSILPSILIFSLSEVFQFCWIHKSLTGYSLLSDLLINTNRYIGLGSLVSPLKSVMVMIGTILFICMLFKLK